MPPNFAPAQSLYHPVTSGAEGYRQQVRSPGRGMMFFFGVALIFIRFSMIHQIIAYQFHLNLYLMYLFGIPATVIAFFSGGAARVLRYRTAVYWVVFVLWLLAAVPFSSWRGGSAGTVYLYLRSEFLMLFVVGAVAVNWRECRVVLQMIAAACAVNLLASHFFSETDSNDRLSLAQFSNVSNSNDFAGHLILVLPFLFWVALTTKSFIIKILSFLGMAWGIYLILASASRGAALAIVVAVLFLDHHQCPRAGARSLSAGRAAGGIFGCLPGPAAHAAADTFLFSVLRGQRVGGSLTVVADSRKTVLRQRKRHHRTPPVWRGAWSIFHRPRGKSSMSPNTVGLWYQTHNSITQVASECGIPALILYVSAIVSSYLLLRKNSRRLKNVPQLADLASALFCMRLAMVSFCTAILFLNFGYFFYLPAMAGIAIISWI